jgi:Rap1a immunity proteins
MYLSRVFSSGLRNSVAAGMMLATALPVFAEEDGEELLAMMSRNTGLEVAMPYIDDVRSKWNGALFCMAGDDLQGAAFAAVKSYLETHPKERYRPRRYLITQAIRDAFPCRGK